MQNNMQRGHHKHAQRQLDKTRCEAHIFHLLQLNTSEPDILHAPLHVGGMRQTYPQMRFCFEPIILLLYKHND